MKLNKIFQKTRENPHRCPKCKSTKGREISEFDGRSQQFRCSNCGKTWSVYFEPAGLEFDGQYYGESTNNEQPTQELQWYELRSANGCHLRCVGCEEEFHNLYIVAPDPDHAAAWAEGEGRCWECSGINLTFPMNATIELEQVYI
jgi:hypothetical protein